MKTKMISILSTLALVLSLSATASELIASKAAAHADAIEDLDARLHEIGEDEKAETVHSLEAVALNIVSFFQKKEATPKLVFGEMQALYEALVVVIRVVGGPGSGIDAETSLKLDAVIDTYKALFYSVYPPSPCGCGCGPAF